MLNSFFQKPRAIVPTGLLAVGLYTVGVLELGRELGRVESEEASSFSRRLRAAGARSLVDCGGHPRRMYGHVHMAKTGGTSVNGILSNRYERVCGNKGNSYDAFRANEVAEEKEERGMEVDSDGPHGKARDALIEATGWEDCDYVSNEERSDWWIANFADREFHGVEMELHVPCRDPVDHLMSQCNFWGVWGPPPQEVKRIACDAATDKEFFASIKSCLVKVKQRYSRELEDHFDVRCFDFKQQFTTYIDVMGERLEDRRVVSDHYVKRETNQPRDKESECIWERPDLVEKARDYLVNHVDYYGFCDKCMGTENDLTLGGWKDTGSEIASK